MNVSDLNEDDAVADIATRLDFYTMVVSGSTAILMAAVVILVPPDGSDSFIGGLMRRFLNLFCDLVL